MNGAELATEIYREGEKGTLSFPNQRHLSCKHAYIWMRSPRHYPGRHSFERTWLIALHRLVWPPVCRTC
jgi:hypothetical protein